MFIFQNYIDVSTRIAVHKKTTKREEKHNLKEFPKIQRESFLDAYKTPIHLIINILNLNKSLQKSIFENQYRVKMGQGQIGSF